MASRVRRGSTVAPLEIPQAYLDCVEVRAYHVELTLDVDTATFSGQVKIPVHIAGGKRRVFYLHSSELVLSSATVGGVRAAIVVNDSAPTTLETPAEAAVTGDQVRC